MDFEAVRLEYRKTVLAVDNVIGPSQGVVSLNVGYVGLLESRDDPIDFELSSSDIAALAAAGDDRGAAIVPGARFVGSGEGNYRIELDPDGDTIYVFVGEGEGDFSVTFTQFANGDYVYLGNGQYLYVGRRQGGYLPLRPLPLPSRTHLTSLGMDYGGQRGNWARIESALSHQDQNLFSEIDDSNNSNIALGFQAGYRSPGSRRYATIEAEYLPADFARLQRLDAVDEEYLWQRSARSVADRQRYTLLAGGGLSHFDISQIELGYTREGSTFDSRRLGWLANIDSLAGNAATWKLDFAESDDGPTSNRLVRVKPRLTNTSLPVTLLLSGEFDVRRQETLGIAVSESRREGEIGAEYAGVSIAARQRENWRKLGEWRMLDRKRTLRSAISRHFKNGNQIDALLLWNALRPRHRSLGRVSDRITKRGLGAYCQHVFGDR